jgi:hypothetical protein
MTPYQMILAQQKKKAIGNFIQVSAQPLLILQN